MKHILILNYEYPPLGGGAGVVSQKYALGLARLGHQVTVLTTWFEGTQQDTSHDGVRVVRVKSRRSKAFQSNPLEMLSWAYHAIKYYDRHLADTHIDMVIAFFSIPGGIVARHIHKRSSIPYMISTHGHDIPGFYPEVMWKFHILTNWYTRKVWQHAKHILILTSEMMKLAQAFLPDTHKHILLPNGCETDFFTPDPSQKSPCYRLLFVGRLVHQKDPQTFLHALVKLQAHTTDFEAYIVGDGPLRSELETLTQALGLSEQVRFTGWVDKETLRNYYQSSHIQVCSSRVEGMSIAILESLYSGLYILSTPVSGNTDMIEPGVSGEFFAHGDSDELADKLITHAQDYASLTLSGEYLHILQKRYNWDAIIQDLADIITS